MSIVLGYDPVSLREKVDLQALGARLDELGPLRSSAALNEKVGLLRLAGRLDEAMEVANAAVRMARFGGDREELVLARVRRAQVLQYLGKLDTALVDLSDCVTEAGSHDWPNAEAFALQHRGKVWFELKEYEKALRDFRDALTIRVRIKAGANQIDASMVAVAVAESFLSPEAAMAGASGGDATSGLGASFDTVPFETVPRDPSLFHTAPRDPASVHTAPFDGAALRRVPADDGLSSSSIESLPVWASAGGSSAPVSAAQHEVAHPHDAADATLFDLADGPADADD